MKLQHVELADGTDVRHRRNRGFKDDCKALNRRKELPKRKRRN